MILFMLIIKMWWCYLALLIAKSVKTFETTISSVFSIPCTALLLCVINHKNYRSTKQNHKHYMQASFWASVSAKASDRVPPCGQEGSKKGGFYPNLTNRLNSTPSCGRMFLMEANFRTLLQIQVIDFNNIHLGLPQGLRPCSSGGPPPPPSCSPHQGCPWEISWCFHQLVLMLYLSLVL